MPPWEKVSNFFLAASFSVFLIGAILYLSPQETASVSLTASPTIIERNIAIKAAKESGSKTYSYTTNFIPGIGKVANPEAYLNQLPR